MGSLCVYWSGFFVCEIKWHGGWLISLCIFHLQRSTRCREAKRRRGGGGRRRRRGGGRKAARVAVGIKPCDRSLGSSLLVQMVWSQKVKALDALEEEAPAKLSTLNWPWLLGQLFPRSARHKFQRKAASIISPACLRLQFFKISININALWIAYYYYFIFVILLLASQYICII